MNLTAGYNADVARVYGINEALLLDSITFWSRNSRRKDGYCWFTADEFEIKTAVKEKAMKRAIDKLVSAGIIEVKNTYIIGTQKRCRHFKILKEPESEQSESTETTVSETAEMTVSEDVKTTTSVNSSNRTLTELLHIDTKVSIAETAKNEKPDNRNDDIEWAFDKWEEIVGYPIKRNDRWNRNSAWNMMRAKDKGRVWLEGMLRGVVLAGDDQYSGIRISNFVDLQKDWEKLLAWGRRNAQQKKKSSRVFSIKEALEAEGTEQNVF